MILIITHKSDYTADFLIDRLNKTGIAYFRLNCDILHIYDYTFEFSPAYNFTINGICNFTSVWYRRTMLAELGEDLSPAERAYLQLEYNSLLSNILSSLQNVRWLSHPLRIQEAENKVLQLKCAVNIGFVIPDTLITSNKERLLAFAKKHDGDLIIKPLGIGRMKAEENKLIYTNQILQEHLKAIDTFDLTPCIIQNNIAKEYELRVTVVGDKIFAAKVDSQSNDSTKVDWRKEKLPFSSYVLPPEIIIKCKRLIDLLQLSFGAIDIIKTKSGQYVFLELNPNGQWAWIESDTGLPIADTIIDFLIQNDDK